MACYEQWIHLEGNQLTTRTILHPETLCCFLWMLMTFNLECKERAFSFKATFLNGHLAGTLKGIT